MSRIQLALNVSDVDEAVDFYRKLFGTEPAKVRPGYANFAIEEPPLKLVLIQGHGDPGTLSHLGVEVDSTDEVGRAQRRLAGDGLADRDRGRRRLLLRGAGQGLGRRTRRRAVGDLHGARRRRSPTPTPTSPRPRATAAAPTRPTKAAHLLTHVAAPCRGDRKLTRGVCEAAAMPEEAFSAEPGAFADVPERITTDYLLYGLQQQMVQLTGQADLKGSIIITASAIVVSVSVTQFNVAELRWSLVTLVAFVLLALLSSVIAVFPKFKIHPEPGDQLPQGFNPFFFGHFSQISRQRHVELMADVLAQRRHHLPRDGRGHLRPGLLHVEEQVPLPALQLRCFLIGFIAAAIAADHHRHRRLGARASSDVRRSCRSGVHARRNRRARRRGMPHRNPARAHR